MNTTENNKLLDNFLQKEGNIISIRNYRGIEIDREYNPNSYHNDWNSLMRVAEKIETVETKDGRTFTIDMHRDSVLIFEYGLTTNEIIFTEGRGRLENLYNACIEFVKWWNEERTDSAEE